MPSETETRAAGEDAARSEPTGRPAPIERASGGQWNADLAAEAAPGAQAPGESLAERQDQLLDEAVQETFPASDPISPARII